VGHDGPASAAEQCQQVVDQPPPSDLQVTNIQFAPTAGKVGEGVSITYTVTNVQHSTDQPNLIGSWSEFDNKNREAETTQLLLARGVPLKG